VAYRARVVELTSEQRDYLRGASFSDSVAGVLASGELQTDGSCRVVVTADVAETVRSELTATLARLGFDRSYEPTKEGLLLEELIDRFAAGTYPSDANAGAQGDEPV